MNIVCMIASLQLGGAEKQLLGLARALHRQGHCVRVLTYRKADFYLPQLEQAGLEHVLIEKKCSDVALSWRIARYLKKISCEVLIAFLPGAGLKACLAHGFYPHFKLIVSERNFSRRLRLHDYFRLTCFRRADKIVCNNYSQEELIRTNYPALADKVLTINNFVDVDSAETPSAASALCATTRILVTARVNRRKNTLSLIYAAARLREKGWNFRVDWYGLSSPNAYARKCQSAIVKLGLEKEFEIHPAVADVLSLYAQSDFFCLPSFYEGTSNSLAESLACGKLVVCSAVGDNVRYVKEGINGFLCDPSSVDSLVASLEKALSLTPLQRAEMGQRSRQIACEQLHPELFIQRYTSLLKEYE